MTSTSDQSADGIEAARKRRLIVVVGCVVAVLAVAATVWHRAGRDVPSGPIPAKPSLLAGWNVLLVSLDTTRADRLGCYGCAGAATPTLDGLASGGVRCEQAVAPAPLTLPAHASLLTGLDPHHHGARVNGLFRVEDRVVTLAERLRDRGYRTGAVVSAYVLDRRYGLSQGFVDYVDDLTVGNKPSRFGFRERTAEQANEVAVRWLSDHADERFFLWVHYFDPHAPYAPPEPYRTRFADRPYDGEIAYVDEQFGRLLAVLDERGVRDRTLVVVVADHGESLGEHQELTHGIMIYDATVRIPMIFSAPGVLAAGTTVRRQVGLIDVVPTVLDLLGMAPPDDLDGRSLLRAWPDEPRALYVESLGPKLQHGWAPLVGIRRHDYKFVQAPRPELYDLQADPNELNNLLASRRDVAERLCEQLSAMARSGGDDASGGNVAMDTASREKLEGLGYVFGMGQAAATQQNLPDPKDRIDDWRLLQQAKTLSNLGRHTEAVKLLEPYAKTHPKDVSAWQVLSESYRAIGRRDLAMTAFRREEALSFRKVEARVGLGSLLLEDGRVDEAEAMYKQALEEDPDSERAVFGLGATLIRRKRPDEALQRFRQCIAMGRGSNTAGAHYNVGAILHAQGRALEARKAFEQSLAADPGFGRAARALAELLRQEGRSTEAVDLLKRSIAERADPDSSVALARLLVATGQPQPAAEALEQVLAVRPGHVAAHYQLALVLLGLGRTDPAMEQLRTCLRLAPDSPQAWLQMGVLLAGRQRPGEARKHLARATELAPKWPTAHYNLGVLLARQDELPSAIEAFRRTVQLDPKHADAHNALGQALLSSGHPDEAARYFRQALELDPKLTAARENLERCTTTTATRRSTSSQANR